MPKDKDRYDSDERLLTQRREEVRCPRMYRVLLHNDDYTTMDFVVDVLKRYFYKGDAEAVHIMLSVHHKGVGVAGVFPYEVAETKVNQVHAFAREHQHPLRCSMEKD